MTDSAWLRTARARCRRTAKARSNREENESPRGLDDGRLRRTMAWPPWTTRIRWTWSMPKTAHGSGPNGPFYINEYKQVIVPVGDTAQYYLAGKYDIPLEFRFKGRTISGQPIGPDNQRLEPGDTWTGPHAGIPYILAASGDDIYYRTRPEPEIEKRVRLSAKRGKTTAAQMARMLSALKGPSGGRFYVNEFGCVFSPINDGATLEYGCLISGNPPQIPVPGRGRGRPCASVNRLGMASRRIIGFAARKTAGRRATAPDNYCGGVPFMRRLERMQSDGEETADRYRRGVRRTRGPDIASTEVTGVDGDHGTQTLQR